MTVAAARRRAGRWLRRRRPARDGEASATIWVAAAPAPTWNLAPNGRDAIIGARPGARRHGLSDGHLPALHAGLAPPAAQRARPAPATRTGSPDRCCAPRSATASGCTSRTWTPRRGSPTPCTSTASATRRAPMVRTCRGSPGAMRTSRSAGAGPTCCAPRATRSACGPTTTTPPRCTPRSTAACTGCSRSGRAASRCPIGSSVVFVAAMGAFQTIDGRAFVGQHPGLPRPGRRAGAVGRDGDGLGAPHLPRPRPPLAHRATGRATRRPSGRPSPSASAGARRIPAPGSTTATWRAT